MPTNDLITVHEAAKLCHVTSHTIRAWIYRGHLTPIKTPNGWHIRLSKTDVQNYDNQRRHPH